MKRFKVKFSGYVWVEAGSEQDAEDLVFNQLNLPDGSDLEAILIEGGVND